MIRDKERLTKSSHILLYLFAAKGIVEQLTAYPTLQKALYPEYYAYYRDKRLDSALRRLYKQGWIKTEYKETKKILSLTAKGELEALFQIAHTSPAPKHWDGRWRLVMFDIPEGARNLRRKLRTILCSLGYRALQASVYTYPYPMNGSAISLLKKSGLMRYIRFARANFDDDSDLRKLFKLPPRKRDGRPN